MSITKRIVCLANSRKFQGRCVAGYERLSEGWTGWIRPVSDREHHEVSASERFCEDGSEPEVLDVIDVPLREARPTGYQTENWLLDPRFRWRKVGRCASSELSALVDRDRPLWIDGYSTSRGSNDEVPLHRTGELDSSLRLVQLQALHLKVFDAGQQFGTSRRRVQGRFRSAGVDYALWVTDPRVERPYLARDDGSYYIDECFLTVSLGETYNGYVHKLIAAVIPNRTEGGRG